MAAVWGGAFENLVSNRHHDVEMCVVKLETWKFERETSFEFKNEKNCSKTLALVLQRPPSAGLSLSPSYIEVY